MDSGFHRTGNTGNEVTFEKTMCEIKKGIKNESGITALFLFAKNLNRFFYHRNRKRELKDKWQ